MYEIPRPVVRILAALAGTVLGVPLFAAGVDFRHPEWLAVIVGNVVAVVSISRWRQARGGVVFVAALIGGIAGLMLMSISPWRSVPYPIGVGTYVGLLPLPSTLLWWALWGHRREDQRGKDGGA
jgi:uncharacterized membrane protein YccC